MTINDKIFGTLEYDYGWYKYTNINFLGENHEIALKISGEEDGVFSEEQYAAYKAFMEKWEELQQELMPQILDYYNRTRQELGYEEMDDEEAEEEDYPPIHTTEELMEHVSIELLKVPYDHLSVDGREMGIVFGCTWDDENGVGISLINEKIAEIGYQDVTF